jgi:hypothetical protein
MPDYPTPHAAMQVAKMRQSVDLTHQPLVEAAKL